MVYSGVYSVTVGAVTISGDHELVEITAPSDQNVVILRAWLQPATNATTPDEAMDVAMGPVTVSGNGGALTPQPLNPNYPAANTTATANGATPPSIPAPLMRQGFHMQQGLTYLPIPEERMWLAGSDVWGFAVLSSPISSYTCLFGIVFAEVG